jgi:hypothetical protein
MAPDDSPPEVLSSLPRTRPQRRSPRRDAARPKQSGTATKASAKPAAKLRKPAARAAPKARKRSAAGASKPRLPAAGFAPPASDEGRTPSGAEIVGTAIQAAGELAQIGLAVGGQALRSALGRARRG